MGLYTIKLFKSVCQSHFLLIFKIQTFLLLLPAFDRTPDRLRSHPLHIERQYSYIFLAQLEHIIL